MRNLAIRARGRRNLAIMAVALAAFGGFAAWRDHQPAQAAPVQIRMNMNCPSGVLGPFTLPIDYLVTVPGAPRAGGALEFTVQPSMRMPAGFPTMSMTNMSITLPNPAATLGVGAIKTTTTGWSVHYNQSPQTIYSSLTPAAPVTLGTAPNLVISGSVNAGATQVVVRGPSEIRFTALMLGQPFEIRCTEVAGNPPLLQVNTVR